MSALLKKENSITGNYSIHGVTLRVHTNSRFIHAPIHRLLGFFSINEPLNSPEILFSLSDSRNAAGLKCSVPEGCELLYAASEKDRFDIRALGVEKMTLYTNNRDSTYYADFGEVGLISYSPKEGTADGYLRNPEEINPNVLSKFIFLFVLTSLLEAKGYYPVHCSAVEKNGKGVIFPGYSGAGKTTTCIALMRQGYGLLSDDRPFLRYGKDGGLEFLAFPDTVDVTDKTIEFFPELGEKEVLKQNRNLRKKSFYAEDIYPGSIKDSCVPKAILYIEISGAQEGHLDDLPKSDALRLFLPHSLVVLDKETARRHFEILSDLVESCDCYRLKLGSDIHDLPALVGSIL